ncbi:MAG: 16S rRNA (cytidine(1402)-2'-O)-methyltransferase, partial [Hyphomicrobiales bacterium]|nr:16S rRNA (cytidine(1402)-2'-O)-methyltransferase [Hyphomicrobiales bacterium]
MVSRYTVLGLAAEAEPLAPGLHIVATPIGNLGDISLRALSTLAAADRVLAEDSRVTKILLAHYGIATPLIPYHEHNAAEMQPQLLARLAAGEKLALVSDAGTPLVSDPGQRLVEAAIAAGHPVTAVPGASAVLAGLVLSGLPGERFYFEGFLPSRTAERRRRIRALAAIPATLVLFEAPHRIAETLQDLAALLGARGAAVARELTKKFETIRRGILPDLAERFAAEPPPKGEIVVIVGPPLGEAEADEVAIDRALAAALATH